jgi:hypothetical protein
MLSSSVRGISECFRALYHPDAAHAFVHHTVIAASLGCDVFAIEPVHVGSPRPSLTAFQCQPMQVDARSRCKTRARPGLSKRGDFTISLFHVPRISGESPALAWHKDELARRVRSHSFLTSLTYACMLPMIQIPSNLIDSSHSTRPEAYTDTLPSCQAPIRLQRVIIFHLDLQTVRHRLDNDLAVSTYKPSSLITPAF